MPGDEHTLARQRSGRDWQNRAANVRLWPIADMAVSTAHVRFRG